MKKIIIILLLITLPVSSFFLILGKNVFTSYFSSDQLSSKGQNSLYRVVIGEYFSLKDEAYSLLGLTKKADVNFILQPSKITELNSNLPLSGGNDKESFMLVDNAVIKGRLRYRGDNSYHWKYPRKSWRFKAKKNSLYEGRRKVNFIIPKGNALLHNHVAYELASLLGLLSPESYLTDISVNNDYNGIKLFTEQIDESYLRKNGRMPNDIYKGDNTGQKGYKGVNVSLFNDPSIWGKASYNNHYEKSNLKPLEKMVEDLLLDKYDIYDLDDFAKMAAFIDLIGSYHIDRQHNWVLYYDAYYERMSPIIWDPLGWWPTWVEKDNVNIMTSELMESLYKNGDFLRKKYAILNKFFSENRTEFASILTQSATKANYYIKKNGYTIGGLHRTYLDEEDSYDAVENFVESVDKRLSKVEKFFLGGVDEDNYKYSLNENIIRLLLGGSKLIKRVIIESDIPLNDVDKVQISILQDDRIKEFDVSNNVQRLTDYSIGLDISLLPGVKTVSILKGSKLEHSPVTYDIQLGDFIGDISNLSLEIDSEKSEKIVVNQVGDIERLAFQKGLTNIINAKIKGTPQFWKGVKVFSGFNIINDDIVIDPGTRIIFEEGATLKVFGKVTAIGTKERPITFEAKDSAKPWGAFVLKDSKANGSIFKYSIFKDGSGNKGNLYEYTAMFSVHNVKNLLVENSQFYDSHETDDMVHLVYSDAIFKNTKFVRSLSDALDVDISNVIIDNCEFIESGNDSIDLMTSNAIVKNTTFIKSADKAISIGESSNLLAVGNLVKFSEIGMQSKDTSKAYIYDTSFIGNKKAVDAYHKNWRYSEGGTITLDNTIFKDNLINATVGKKSKVIINNSTIDTPDNFDTKSVKKGKIVLSDEKIITPDFNLEFFKDAITIQHERGGISYE